MRKEMSSTAFAVVDIFEKTISEYAGSKYAVAVDSCCGALFLSCVYSRKFSDVVFLPRFTYPGVACSVIHAGMKVYFRAEEWRGIYHLDPLPVIDGALRFSRGMYLGGFHCLSFHAKKHLPIGRGGMI